MQFQVTNTSKFFNLSERDVKVIADVIDCFGHEGQSKLIQHLLKIFYDDIKPSHYAVLGYLIGYRNATEKERFKINKQLSLCLRQN